MNTISPFRYTLLILCALACTLSACAHYPVPEFNGPGGDLVRTDATGFVVNEQGYRHLLSEGGRPDMFVPVADGYHITNGEWHDLDAIRMKGQP